MDVVLLTANILITGASGFTGIHACSYFRKRGIRVTAVSRNPKRAKPEADHIAACDLTDYDSVRDLVCEQRPDYVLHLAGMNDVRTSWQDPLDCMTTNVTGTLHLLHAVSCLSHKPAMLVVGSMLSFDPGSEPPLPSHPYALSKTVQALAARSWAHLYSLPIMVAEPSNLIGPGSSSGLCGLLADYIARWERGMHDEPFRFSSMHEKRDYLDVRDAVAAYASILLSGSPGALYRFGSGQLRSIRQVLGSFTATVGRGIPYLNLDKPPRDPDPRPAPLDPIYRLGWRPAISFEQSVRDILYDARARLAAQLQEEGDTP